MYKPNFYTYSLISESICSIGNVHYTSCCVESRTELDSHANMAVLGQHCTILGDTGKTAKVNAFRPDCKALNNVRIVDAALKWHDPYSDELFIIRVNNALYVPSMNNNLIPPFSHEGSRSSG